MIYLVLTSTQNFSYERRIICQKKFKNKTIVARNLLSKICAELIEYLKEILNSSQFVDRHKQSQKNFIRQRKLPFQTLFLFFINFIKGSYQVDVSRPLVVIFLILF